MAIILFLCLVFIGSLFLHKQKIIEPKETKEPMTTIQTNTSTLEPGPFTEKTPKGQIGLVSMMKSPKNIDTWLETHRQLGIARFYIRLEDTPAVEPYLSEQADVVLQIGQSTGVNEYTDKQRRQDDWLNEALQQAQTDGLEWLIQIDSDELLAGDLDEIRRLPEEVRTFWMQNEEAKYAKIPQAADQCFAAAKFTNCAKDPTGCVSYGNGKGGGRVAKDVSANGPHRFRSTLANLAEEVKIQGVIVQHYESCDFDLYKEKYRGLAKQDRDENIPFSYYKESIEAAKLPGVEGDRAMEIIFEKYRVIS